MEKPFNVVDFVIDYEAGKLNEEEVIEGFQQLVNSNLILSLQGSYGRTAAVLIKQGQITDTYHQFG